MAMQTLQLGATITLVDQFSKNANIVTQSAQAMQQTMGRVGSVATQAGADLDKAGKGTKGLGGGADKAKGSVKGLGDSVDGLVSGVAGYLSLGALKSMFAEPLADARAFGIQAGQIRSIIDEASFSTEAMRNATFGLAKTYGADVITSAGALYETISAGVTDAAKATDLLAVANEFAIGGNSSLAGAIDILTSSVNAYGAQGVTARQASDVLFQAIAAGKTTAEQLSASLGRVMPTAQAMGVSFKEMAGAIATATVQGINTSEAVSGLKAVLTGIAKPAKDAKDEAKRLGIEFDATAIKTMGLAGVLNQISASGKADNDTFVKLFGSVEALNLAQVLAANGGAKMNDVMKSMADISEELRPSIGNTKKAFDIMAQSSDFQHRQFDAMRKNVSVLVGEALEPLQAKLFGVANTVMTAFMSIPAPIRDVGVRVIAVVGGIVGGIVSLIAIGIALKPVFVAIGGILSAVFAVGAKVLVGFGAAIAVAAGLAYTLYYAYKNNLGGLATMVDGAITTVKTAFGALSQLFSQGYISGPLVGELKKAENEGLLNFVTKVFTFVSRIQNFFSNIGTGFKAGMAAAEPVFAAFTGAISKLGDAFSGIGSAIDPAATKGKFDAYGSAGKTFGGVLATVATTVVRALTIAINVVTWFITLWGRASAAGQAAGESIRGTFASIGAYISSVLSPIGAWLSGIWEKVKVAFAPITAIVMDTFAEVKSAVNDAVGGIISIWNSIKSTVSAVWDGVKTIVIAALTPLVAKAKEIWANIVEGSAPIRAKIGEIVSMVVEAATAAKAFLAAGWSKLVTYLQPVIQGLSVAWGWVKSLAATFFDVGRGVSFYSTVFSAIGTAISTAFSIAVVMLKGSVNEIATVIKGIIATVRGVVDIVGGIISGDWGRVWKGFKTIGTTAVMSFISLFGNVAETIAGVVDKIAAAFGKKTDLAGAVAAFKAQAETTVKAQIDAIGAPGTPSPGPSLVAPVPTPAEATSGNAAATAASSQAQNFSGLASQIAASSNRPVKVENKLEAKLMVDGRDMNATLEDVRSTEQTLSYG